MVSATARCVTSAVTCRPSSPASLQLPGPVGLRKRAVRRLVRRHPRLIRSRPRPERRRAHLLDVVGATEDGCSEFTWSSTPRTHRKHRCEPWPIDGAGPAGDHRALRPARRWGMQPLGLPVDSSRPDRSGPPGGRRPSRRGHLPADSHAGRHGLPRAAQHLFWRVLQPGRYTCPECRIHRRWAPPGRRWSIGRRSCAAACSGRTLTSRCRWCGATAQSRCVTTIGPGCQTICSGRSRNCYSPANVPRVWTWPWRR